MNGERRREDREAGRTTQDHFGPLLEPDEAQTAPLLRKPAVRKPKPLAKKRPGTEQRSQGRGSRGYIGGMTEMQARFVEEYLKDMNARQAAIRAGYAADSAHVTGHRLRNANKRVKAAIDCLVDEARTKAKISADEVLERMTALAHSNMGDFAEWDGNGVRLKDSSTLTRAQLYAVELLTEDPAIRCDKMSKDASVKIKLRSPVDALMFMGKVHGLIPHTSGGRVAVGAPRGGSVSIESEPGTVVLVLPDNGRGDGPTPLPPLPPKLP
jgi:phage terminase small subunit